MMQTAQELMQRLAQAREQAGGDLLARLRARNAKADFSHLDDPGLWQRIGAAPTIEGDDDLEPEVEATKPTQPRRKPPRMDPMRTACRMIAKNPNLIAVIKPNGDFEIRAAAVSATSIEPSLDAGADDEVWNAIAAIRGH
jgi:hypothetical protein